MLNFGSALKPPRNITPAGMLGPIPIGRISGSDCKFRIQTGYSLSLKCQRRQKSPPRHVRMAMKSNGRIRLLCNRSVNPLLPGVATMSVSNVARVSKIHRPPVRTRTRGVTMGWRCGSTSNVEMKTRGYL